MRGTGVSQFEAMEWLERGNNGWHVEMADVDAAAAGRIPVSYSVQVDNAGKVVRVEMPRSPNCQIVSAETLADLRAEGYSVEVIHGCTLAAMGWL